MIGEIALHGPHHGAQKSTSTGTSEVRTSCSKDSSVVSTAFSLEAPGERGDAQRGHLPHRLEDDRAVHLRASLLAVDEGDRNFGDGEPGPQGPIRRLDLERVAARPYRREVDRLEPSPPVALETAGRVAHRHAEPGPRVEAARRPDEPACRAPRHR